MGELNILKNEKSVECDACKKEITNYFLGIATVMNTMQVEEKENVKIKLQFQEYIIFEYS